MANMLIARILILSALLSPTLAAAQAIPSPPSPPINLEVSIKDHLYSIMAERDRLYSQKFDSQEKAVQAALAAAEKALEKAEKSSEKRFDSVNEFRSTLKDQQSTLASKAEMDVRFRATEEKINEASKVLHERLNQITIRLNDIATNQVHQASLTQGAASLWGYIVGAAGVVAGLGFLVIAFFNRRDAHAVRARESTQ